MTTKEQKVKLPCNVCNHVYYPVVEEEKWQTYQRGFNVAEIWPEPEYDSAYREQMIGLRSGYHVCDKCWDVVMPDEEE